MTIASDHYARTGKTVAETCREMYAAGKGITHAARHIGFGHASRLRRFFTGLGIECPWPVEHISQPAEPISDEEVAQFRGLSQRMSQSRAAARIGRSADSLRRKMKQVAA